MKHFMNVITNIWISEGQRKEEKVTQQTNNSKISHLSINIELPQQPRRRCRRTRQTQADVLKRLETPHRAAVLRQWH